MGRVLLVSGDASSRRSTQATLLSSHHPYVVVAVPSVQAGRAALDKSTFDLVIVGERETAAIADLASATSTPVIALLPAGTPADAALAAGAASTLPAPLRPADVAGLLAVKKAPLPPLFTGSGASRAVRFAAEPAAVKADASPQASPGVTTDTPPQPHPAPRAGDHESGVDGVAAADSAHAAAASAAVAALAAAAAAAEEEEAASVAESLWALSHAPAAVKAPTPAKRPAAAAGSPSHRSPVVPAKVCKAGKASTPRAAAPPAPRPASPAPHPLDDPSTPRTPAACAANRAAALARFRAKREAAKAAGVAGAVRYESRRRLAVARPRVKGQFVKAEVAAAYYAAEAAKKAAASAAAAGAGQAAGPAVVDAVGSA